MKNESSIRLGGSSYNSAGGLWSTRANTYKNWRAIISVKVKGKGNVGGEGMAFWYTKDKSSSKTSVFGGKNKWTGLGVFLDSFDHDGKKDNPGLSTVINDGRMEYNVMTDGRGQNLGHCFCDFRNARAARFFLRITYYDGNLKIEFDKSSYGRVYEVCSEHKGVDLSTGFFFGITALNNGLGDNHDLYSMDIFEWSPQAPNVSSSLPDVSEEEYEVSRLGCSSN